MSDRHAAARRRWNACRLDRDATRGHYESYFQRANHPTRPQAFWIRYTIFSPAGRPEAAEGELWAMAFDGERIVATYEAHPLASCSFSDERLAARIGEATLDVNQLQGRAASGGHAIGWRLTYRDGDAPLLLLPEPFYARSFPKAKALVGAPNAVFDGVLDVDGQAWSIDGWVGSQNHNWGSKHTDAYAWGQVAGFDDAPDAFFECSTARVRLGPAWTPWMTLMVLRLGADDAAPGETLALNGLLRAARSFGRYTQEDARFVWRLDARHRRAGVRIQGRFEAPTSAFVGLTYRDPPGGARTCLNSKLARCALTVERRGRPTLRLESTRRAAFEILTTRADHGVPVLV